MMAMTKRMINDPQRPKKPIERLNTFPKYYFERKLWSICVIEVI